MSDLHAFLNTASNFADILFKPGAPDDPMLAHIYAEARDGKTTMFTCPTMDGGEGEIMFRVGIPAMLRRERWRRWCFFAEAWAAEGTARQLAVMPPKQRPDRMEVVTFAAEDGRTGKTLTASRQIFRTPGQPAKLLPLVFKQIPTRFMMAPP
jgi:hypothetical protein